MLKRYASPLIFLTTMLVGGSLLMSQIEGPGLFRSFTLLITELTYWLLHGLGFAVQRHETFLYSTTHPVSLEVGNNCNGAWAHLIFLASVLSYPARWTEKLVGLVVGEVLLFGLNLCRIGSLFALGLYSAEALHIAHVYVWQFLIIALALLLFFVWVDRVVRHPA